MYEKRESEYQHHPVINKIIEDLPGGGTLSRKSFPSNLDEVPAGIVVGEDSNGLLQPIKTGSISLASEEDAVLYYVEGHHFKIGDYVTLDGLTGAAVEVTEVTDNTLTVNESLGAVEEGDILLQAKRVAEVGAAELIVEPIGISMSKVDLTVPNQTTGVLRRGSVNALQLFYPLSSTISEKLSLIRFE